MPWVSHCHFGVRSGCREHEAKRVIHQLRSWKSCVSGRALEAMLSWRKGSSEKETCPLPKFVFWAFFFFLDDIFSVVQFCGNHHNLELVDFPLP